MKKLRSVNWQNVLLWLAALAMFVLAAGAPHGYGG